MRRLTTRLLLLPVLACLVPGLVSAELLSKSYHFKPGVTLEIGAAADPGLRVDSVRFRVPPASADGRHERTSGMVSAEVAVSNLGQKSAMIGLAIALYDKQGRLVGASSGGSKLMPLKAGRQKTFTLVFDFVNAYAHQADTFQLSAEAR